MPPGLGLVKLTALPAHLDEDAINSRSTSRPSSRASLKRQTSAQQILPVLPLRPGTPAARSGTPARQIGEGKVERGIEETPTKVPKRAQGAKVGEKKDEGSTEAAEEAKAKEVVAEQAKSAATVATPIAKPQEIDQVKENKPAVAPTTAQAPASPKARKTSVPFAMQPASKGSATVQTSDAKAAPVTPSKPEPTKGDDGQKRKHPGKLDITAAVKKQGEATTAATTGAAATTMTTPVEIGTPGKVAQRNVAQTPSAVSKPESPSVGSPAIKNAPRTLRLTQTPKAETPPPQSTVATPVLPTPPAAFGKLPSRKPSVASINPPGTPTSEHVSISDNISMTSTSQSRANSPPPPGAGKVGSAPVRSKTKSQLKKERQERAKAIEEAKIEEGVPTAAEEAAQEAIVSRKKKAKKEKEPKARSKAADAVTGTAETTPTASRPPSPGEKAVVEDVTNVANPVVTAPAVPIESKPSTPSKVAVSTPSMPSPHEPSPPPTPTLTAAALLADLKMSAPEIQKCIDSLFRTPTSAQFKTDQKISAKDLQSPASWKHDFKINLTKDEVDALLKGTMPALHYGGTDGRIWDRGMITPTGAHLRALTEELEARFLDLEGALRAMPDELRFRPSKPQNEIRFPNVDLEALKRQFDNVGGRAVSAMEQMVQDGSTMKKGAFLVDEASKYINEFVMPPVTPPPSATGGGARAGGGGAGQHQHYPPQAAAGGGLMAPDVMLAPSVDIAERSWTESRRVADEKENALKKVIRKNKKLLGLG